MQMPPPMATLSGFAGCSADPANLAATHKIDLRAGFAQEDRRFAGALPPSDHRDPLAPPLIKPGVGARMADEIRTDPLELTRYQILARKPRGDHYAAGVDRRLVVEHQAKAARGRLGARDLPQVKSGNRMMLKPLAI